MAIQEIIKIILKNLSSIIAYTTAMLGSALLAVGLAVISCLWRETRLRPLRQALEALNLLNDDPGNAYRVQLDLLLKEFLVAGVATVFLSIVTIFSSALKRRVLVLVAAIVNGITAVTLLPLLQRAVTEITTSLRDAMRKSLSEMFNAYKLTSDSRYIDTLQQIGGCCGLKTFAEFAPSFPRSCCRDPLSMNCTLEIEVKPIACEKVYTELSEGFQPVLFITVVASLCSLNVIFCVAYFFMRTIFSAVQRLLS